MCHHAIIPSSFVQELAVGISYLSGEISSTCRFIPAFVALTTGAAAYYLGRSSGDSRLAGKKNKKVRGRKVEWMLHPVCCKGAGWLHQVWISVQAFLLLIQHDYKSIRDRDAFIELFKPLAKYVTQHEPETLAYELAISDKDPHKLLVFER